MRAYKYFFNTEFWAYLSFKQAIRNQQTSEKFPFLSIEEKTMLCSSLEGRNNLCKGG